MKIVSILFVFVLAGFGAAVLLKRLSAAGELPVDASDDGVPLTPVPTFQEAP